MSASSLTVDPAPNDDAMDQSRDIRRQHLARELHRRSMQKMLSQADISRATGLGRDSISRYFRGQTQPDPLSVLKLARALDCKPRDLDPGAVDVPLQPPANGAPAMDVRQSSSDPTKGVLQINLELPFRTIAEIMRLVDEQMRTPKED